MKVQRYQLVIVSIVILASAGLFYFINQNYKETTENSLQIRKTRDILKNIDTAFYTISELEINTQNNANHVHTVVRDLLHDYGGDQLLEHYKKGHLH